MKNPTERQLEFYNFIKGFISEKGISPSFREIGGNFGISLRATSDHLYALRRKGLIDFTPGVSRSIHTTK